jgi:hypothetical protein
MKLAGVCPACEQHVEFVTTERGSHKCSNCWHYLDDQELERAQKIAEQLHELDVRRQKILEG